VYCAVRTGPSQKSDYVSSFKDETFDSIITHLAVAEFKYGPEDRLSWALASSSLADPSNVVIVPYVRSAARPSISFTNVYFLITHPFKVVLTKPVFLNLPGTADPTKLSVTLPIPPPDHVDLRILRHNSWQHSKFE
jgi:hypothetical protein